MKYFVYNYVNRQKVDNKEFVDKNLFSDNIGNIFFLQGVCNSIDGDITGNPNEQDIDAYILPLANMFRGEGKIQEIDYLKHLLCNAGEKKIIVVGVGAQGTLEYTRNYTDSEAETSAVEFCNYILKHSKSIGVRGEYTKHYLISLGVEPSKIDIIGCPSTEMFGKKFNTKMKVYKPFSNKINIAVNFTPNDYYENIAIFLYKIFKNYDNSFAMMQDKVEYDMLYCGKEIMQKDRVHALLPTYKDHFIIRNRRARMFLSVEEWRGCLSTFNFSIGTRIHGNIIAILSGCPAMVIAIDSRTRELAEYHHIPYITMNEIDENTSLELLYYRACAGMNDFYLHYKDTLKTYKEVMDKNGINLKPDWACLY